MSTEDETRGRVVTFYSYKGGVGRTMSLANVAFLAAYNGHNVLMMDWDLEAPGLYHYFRGLVEPEVMSEWRNAKGVLDLAWQWRTEIENAEDESDIDRLIERYESGQVFEEVIKGIESEGAEHITGKLDMIPAGSATIQAYREIGYEQALAEFSWADFLSIYAGGQMIAALREWAVRNYDLVLIDSRTGLADVAGICTMQLPDVVMLMFVLNRQNIEGAARVAAAIRATRGDAIEIRAVPMRVSREGTEEEADASARALRELTKVGSLPTEQVERDLQDLFVKAEPSIPFMESLAIFNETKAALDPFTADMGRLAVHIVGSSIELPEIDDAWRSTVQGRLSTTMSTPSYLRQLEKADPRRAMIIAHRYVESALSSIAEGDEPSASYLEALVEAVFLAWSRAEEAGESYGLDTIDRLIMLLRKINSHDRELWNPLLVRALETSIYSDGAYHGRESEVVIFEEMEDLLSGVAQTPERLLERADLKLRMARQITDPEDIFPRLSIIDDALSLLDAAEDRRGRRDRHLDETRIEALIQKSDILAEAHEPNDAIMLLDEAVTVLNSYDAEDESDPLRFEIEFRLMRGHHLLVPGGKEAMHHAARALGTPMAPFSTFLPRLPEFAEVLDKTQVKAPEFASRLLEQLVDETVVATVGRHFARSPVRMAAIVDGLRIAIRHLGDCLDDDSIVDRKTAAAATLVEHVIAVERRFVPMMRRTTGLGTGHSLHTFLVAAQNAKELLLAHPSSPDIRASMAVAEQHLATLGQAFFPRGGPAEDA